MLQILYTVLIGLSAGAVTFAAAACVQFVYPSMALFFPRQSGHLPYGAVMSVVVLLFLFSVYVTPLLVLAGLLLLLMLMWDSLKPLPAGAKTVGVAMAVGLSMWGEFSRVQEMGFGPLVLVLMAGYAVVPLFALLASGGDVRDGKALKITALVLLAAAVAGPVMTGGLTHGTPAAMVMVCAIGATLLQHARKPGSLGAAGLLPVALGASHVALTMAHAGAMWLALGVLGVLAFGYLVIAGVVRR